MTSSIPDLFQWAIRLGVIGALFLAVLAGPAVAERLSENDLKEYRTAFKAIDAGRWDVALKHAARPSNPIPAKAVRWLYLQSANSGASFQEIRDFVAQNRGWPRLERLTLRAEQAMSEALEDREILSWFRDNPPQTGDGFLLYAAALERAGMDKMLDAQLRRVWREVDMPGATEQEIRRAYRKRLALEDELFRLERLLWEGKTGAALRQARRVPDAYRRLAEARVKLRQQSGGVDGAIARVPPNLQNDPGLTYERLRWRRKKGRFDGALELLSDPDMQVAHPDLWWRERAILARDILEEGDPELAYEVASNHRATSGAPFAEAEWFSGWVALRFLNDPQRAFPHFRDMYMGVGFPVSRSRAAYWAGRAAEAAGESTIALEWYGVAAKHTASFYGQVAAMKLPPTARPVPITRNAIPDDRRRAFEASELTRVTRLLGQIGADDTVRTLIRHLSTQYRDPAFLALTAELATEIDRIDLAVLASRQAIKSNAIVLAGYPQLPVTTSRIRDLSIVHGLIRQESGFDIDAISRAGARGLMQLMPATAETVSRWERVSYRKAALTSDINYNVQLGSAYLADLLEKFDGVLPMALAGYNAGPHRVTQWIERFGDPRGMTFEETLDWMESIPFHETRDYVQRVLENVTVYRQRDAGRAVAITMRAGTG
jgi:soluble lytic murein transglycosylase